MLVRFPAVVVLRLLYRSRAARRTTVRPSYQIAMKREGKCAETGRPRFARQRENSRPGWRSKSARPAVAPEIRGDGGGDGYNGYASPPGSPRDRVPRPAAPFGDLLRGAACRLRSGGRQADGTGSRRNLETCSVGHHGEQVDRVQVDVDARRCRRRCARWPRPGPTSMPAPSEQPCTPRRGRAASERRLAVAVHHVERRLARARRSAVSKGAGSPPCMPSGVAFDDDGPRPRMACRGRGVAAELEARVAS